MLAERWRSQFGTDAARRRCTPSCPLFRTRRGPKAAWSEGGAICRTSASLADFLNPHDSFRFRRNSQLAARSRFCFGRGRLALVSLGRRSGQAGCMRCAGGKVGANARFGPLGAVAKGHFGSLGWQNPRSEFLCDGSTGTKPRICAMFSLGLARGSLTLAACGRYPQPSSNTFVRKISHLTRERGGLGGTIGPWILYLLLWKTTSAALWRLWRCACGRARWMR